MLVDFMRSKERVIANDDRDKKYVHAFCDHHCVGLLESVWATKFFMDVRYWPFSHTRRIVV